MKNKSAIISFVLTTLIFVLFFPKIFFHPDQYLFTDTGDGIKSYYVYAEHIRNSKGFLEIENLNYPYGITHVYSDGQFLITNIIKILKSVIPWMAEHCIGIFNLMILFSFPLAAFFLSLIFKRLLVPEWFAVVSSIVIAAFSPQIFRIGGHLTLSYAFAFPMSWWLLLRFSDNGFRWKDALLCIIIFTLLFFIHPYHTAISVFFAACLFLFYLLFSRVRKRMRIRWIIPCLLVIVLPLLIPQIFLHLTDFHSSRPLMPIGFWWNNATPNSVFAPSQSPFRSMFEAFISLENQRWEGWSFIGMTPLFILIILSVRFIKSRFRNRLILKINSTQPVWLSSSVLAAFVLLLFSMLIPFRFNMKFLLDWFPIIYQFRALGRFAWPFYYVIGVFTFYNLWKMSRTLSIHKMKFSALLFSCFFLLTSFTEVFFQVRACSGDSKNIPNWFNPDKLTSPMKELLGEVNKIKNNYQCLVPLPFYHIGSDNFMSVDQNNSMRISMITSYYENIPLLASSAARTPIQEAKNIMQFFSPPGFQKAIKQDLPSNKPFLILYTGEEPDSQESYWIKKASLLWSNDEYKLYDLPYNVVFYPDSGEEEKLFAENTSNSEFVNNEVSGIAPIYYNGFNELNSPYTYAGKGALSGDRNQYVILFKDLQLNLSADTEYHVSLWYYNKGEARNQAEFVLEDKNPETGEGSWSYTLSPIRSKVIDGDWSLIEIKFNVKRTGNLLSAFFIEDEHSSQMIYADEIMIRKFSDTIYSTSTGTGYSGRAKIYKNNIPIYPQTR